MKTFMFPGQGSQFKGMGEDLFDEFGDLTEKADRILGYSIKKLCLESPKGDLHKTQFTQPALYTVNALSYFKKIKEDNQQPDFLAGHSLGEFTALMAAGCFDFETGLKLVKKRGELMGQVSGGGMAAILNASKEQIEKVLKDEGLDEVYLANYNSPSQIVVSGSAEQIAKVHPLFEQGDTRCFPLNTSGAFHSKFMSDAMEQFREYLNEHTFSQPDIPVMSNVTARPYEKGRILETLSRQIANTVQWSESIQYLLAVAQNAGRTMEFQEVGPGDVLTELVSTIKQQTPPSTLVVIAAQLDGDQKSAQATKAPDTVGDEEVGEANEGGTGTGNTPGPVTDAGNVQAGLGGQDGSDEKVRTWNERYPVGTRVKSTVLDYDELETRTEAVVLFGHRAAVYMKGYNGYFDLDELEPLEA